MLGVFLSVLSALAFSSSDVAVRRGVARAPVSHAAFITVVMGVPLFALAALVSGQLLRLGDLPASGYGYLALAGLVHYLVGRYFNYAAIEAIGAARASPVQALSLPYSVLVALLLLDEGVTTGMLAGIALVVTGPFVMLERRRQRPLERPPAASSAVATAAAEGVRLRQAEGYIYATLSAMSYGSSPVLIRAALEGESGLSILGGLVSYLAAAVVLLLSLALPQRRGLVASLQPESVRIFFAGGFLVFLAQLLRFTALSLASVAVVTTLLRFGTIFTLLLSWLLNRSLEFITLRTVLGVLISVAGAVLMVVARP